MGALIGRLLAASLVLFATQAAAAPGDTSDIPARAPIDPDYAQAELAVKAKDWDQAIAALNRTLARTPDSADAHNLLGYAERHRGNLPAAFQHYEKALALNPRHRGAHEYVGEAYLMVDNLAKAEEHLKALDRLCFFGCDEYSDLKAKIAAYRTGRGSTAATAR
jgi:tetratricopeptide (TPR) repeat protein